MLEYGLEIPADQIFHWLKDELASGRQRFVCRGTRDYVADVLGKVENTDIDEDYGIQMITTTGTLEISPAGAANGWLLKVYVEDVVGPHIPEDSSVPAEPEEIQLDDFYAQFIAPDTGTVFVTVSAESKSAKAQFDAVLTEIIEDRHGMSTQSIAERQD